MFICVLVSALIALILPQAAPAQPPADSRPRVIVSTDIGGTDPDDFQSMVHVLDAGAKHVNRWRRDFLQDFAARMQRCTTAALQR
jgi:hypothetical protein